MTTRRPGGRDAVTHYLVKRKLNTVYGKFALLELKIETGRTHQIRVHLSSINHPVVGDTLYGAAGELKSESGKVRSAGQPRTLTLDRNFLHSAALELKHPKTGETMSFSSALPGELETFLADLGQSE
jgi:23S rRNA pseudouridine1911/1915/1917 synthase